VVPTDDKPGRTIAPVRAKGPRTQQRVRAIEGPRLEALVSGLAFEALASSKSRCSVQFPSRSQKA